MYKPYSSDSSSAAVFENPNSAYAASRTPEALLEDYSIVHSGGEAVFQGFFNFMYGQEINLESQSDFPDPSTFVANTGGGTQASLMMAELFEQRTEDLDLVIDAIVAMNETEGVLQGKIDVDNIGVMGQSLGSITTQSALVHIPEVKTAIAFNNGLPKSWEPYGGFPDDSGDVDNPDGVKKDILYVIGSDDNFVHMVFKDIFHKWFVNAGGDLNETMQLPAERVWPTEDNPQPVARSAYERSRANKMLITFKDQGHDTNTDDLSLRPMQRMQGQRVPLDNGETDAIRAERYDILGWINVEDKQVYLPHVMRNYYIKAWFDWQLKGDDSQRELLVDHPFGEGVKQLLQEGVH